MLLENIRLAAASLATNRMRTFLTMLGIIIGVASIISIMTVSDAMNQSVMDSMGDIGANTISFYIVSKDSEDEYMEETAEVRPMQDKDYFDDERFAALLYAYPQQIEGISLSRSVEDVQLEDAKNSANISIKGVNSCALKQLHLSLPEGRVFGKGEYKSAGNVALVSDIYVENMFGGDAKKAVGRTLETLLGNSYVSFTIIGVYEYKDNAESATEKRRDINTDVYIPLQTALKVTRETPRYDSFDVIVKNDVDTQVFMEEMLAYVNERMYGENDAYEAYAFCMKEYIEQTKKMLGTQKMAFMAIGAISLLVGGIGVMNIMIVSIVERTSEIGTRKALGATNLDIRLQFMTESIVVCLIGGAMGIIAGISFGRVASKLLGYLGHPSLTGVVGCLLFSIVFGMFFGYYPAGKAARMNPIDALRAS